LLCPSTCSFRLPLYTLSEVDMPSVFTVHNVGTRYRKLGLQLCVRALVQHCRNLGKGSTVKSISSFQSIRFYCVTASVECIDVAVGCWRFKVFVPGEQVQAPSAQAPQTFPTVQSSMTALTITLLPHIPPAPKLQLPCSRRDYPKSCLRSSFAYVLRVSLPATRVSEGRLPRPPLAVMLSAS
jgi:hypothetical protein